MAALDYIGSKYSLTPVLFKCMEESMEKPFSSVTSFGDLLSGSGSMSKAAIDAGCPHVISNDALEFCKVSAAPLTRNGVDVIKLYKWLGVINKTLETLNDDIDYDTLPETFFITHHYSKEPNSENTETQRAYFTKSNGHRIDVVRQQIEILHKFKKINDREKDVLVYSLVRAANKVSNTSATYGAYLKEFKKSALETLDMKLIITDTEVPIKHDIYRQDVFELLKKIDTQMIQVVYIDPPYNHRRYDKNYHVLETIALYDSPELTGGTTGLRLHSDDDTHGKFCHKKQVKGAYENLFKLIKSPWLFVSYNHEGLLSQDEMESLLKQTRKNVTIFEVEHKRFKAKPVTKSNVVTEYLFAASEYKITD